MDGIRGGTALEPPRTRPAEPRRKGAVRPVPVRSAAHAHLALTDLRTYRRALNEEEGRVSYWRRILQARLDAVRAEVDGGTTRPLDAVTLRPVTDSRVRAGRTALLHVVPVDDIPPLPQLDQLWERRTEPGDTAGLAALEAELAVAERQLSDYRAALHRRIADATGELIARYREQPSLCLSALPLPPEHAPRPG